MAEYAEKVEMANKIMHLVPFEQTDGTIVNLLISYNHNDNLELVIDSIEGDSAPKMENEFIYIDKTITLDDFMNVVTHPDAAKNPKGKEAKKNRVFVSAFFPLLKGTLNKKKKEILISSPPSLRKTILRFY